ncbi:hypothetical protein DFH28DRAFT_896649 [Melampsora americana]|nr:hypothetical protein DFH28DRAFT_896649 [Melampsora americana]
MHKDALAVIYATRWQEVFLRFRRKYRTSNPAFAEYFQFQWVQNYSHCMISERDVPMQGIHTNNFTESYHRVLKYNFLSRHTLQRPDDAIQVLVNNAEPEFRQSVISTSLGFRPQHTTRFQNIAKGLADSYSATDLRDLGVTFVKSGSNKWTISSFTRPFAISYDAHCTLPNASHAGYVNNCTCCHYVKTKLACKHMCVLARQTGYKILKTDPEINNGHSLFAPRGITQPFNLVVNVMTSIHPDSLPPSPPMNPYCSSSGMAQTPSTSGLTSGTFPYPPMVPARILYKCSESTLAHSRFPAGTVRTYSNHPPPSQISPNTSSRWLPVSTHLTTGRMDHASDSYISRLMEDPHHLQSTPPRLGSGSHSNILYRGGPAPYPSSPFAWAAHHHSPSTTTRTSNTSFLQPHSPQSHRRHHPYSRQDNSAAALTFLLPSGPPPTQDNYKFNPYSLTWHLAPHAALPTPQVPLHQPSVRTPEVTPTPVTTSQLDGLFHKMEAGHA